jgi:putative ABC transport system ATP-binding protein
VSGNPTWPLAPAIPYCLSHLSFLNIRICEIRSFPSGPCLSRRSFWLDPFVIYAYGEELSEDHAKDWEYPSMPLLEARHISKTYSVDHRSIAVLDDISLSVETGDFVVISGSSGSGKTTLLTVLSGLDRPSSGRVIIDGQDITEAPEAALAPMRNHTIGFVFQSFHLVPSMTAMENIMFPAQLRGDTDAAQRARDLLESVGMSHRGDNLPSQLSGGEKQRIALCRALINRPKLLFADEPTGNLDTANGKIVLEQLIELKKAHGATLILVTHNPKIAQAADRILTLQDGRLTG